MSGLSFDDGAHRLSASLDITVFKGSMQADIEANLFPCLPAHMDGIIGRGVKSAAIVDGDLVLTFTDGKTINIGPVVGDPGSPGEDGYSPSVSVVPITGGHRVTITDADGDHAFEVMDGTDGQDGHSPVVEAVRHPQLPITVIRVDGVQQATIRDGATGPKGDPGEPGPKGDPGEPGTTDHTALTNRNAANQHSIGAITDLQASLDGKAAAIHKHTVDDLGDFHPVELTLKPNTYVETNGPERPYSGWTSTDFIPVEPGKRYQLYWNLSSSYCCWYKSDRTFLSQVTFNAGMNDVFAPPNAAFLRVSNRDAAMTTLTVSTVQGLELVKTVNGISPDSGGNVALSIPPALPPGGAPGQYLRKNPETGDAEWADIEIPSYYGLITYDGNTITVS